MLYVYHFDIASVLLTAMLLLIVYVRKAYPNKQCRYYKALLWLNLISSSSDLLSTFLIEYAQSVPLSFNYFVSVVYLLSHSLLSIVFLLYVLISVRGNTGLPAERAFWVSVTSVDIALITSTPMTHAFIYFDENLQYCHGPLFFLIYVISFSSMLYAFYLFVRFRKDMTRFQLVSISSFQILILGAVVFQIFVPTVLIESFCIAIGLLMLNLALDNPAAYFYRSTYCFNQTSFSDTMTDRLNGEDPFVLLAFAFDDLQVFRKRYGESAYQNLLYRTIDLCHRLFGQRHTFLLDSKAFVILLDNINYNLAIEQLIGSAGKDSPGKEPGKGNVADLTPHFAVYQHPGSANTPEAVIETVNAMLTDIYHKTNEQVVHDDESILEQKHREEQIVAMLRDALNNDGFDMFYQPIFEQKTGKFLSAEALIRLRKQPENGKYVGPDEFIPIAEKNGMILDMGAVAFEKVCRFWRDAKLGDLGIKYIEVNLSLLQLLELKEAERLVNICRRYGIPPEKFNLEITETAGAANAEKKNMQKTIAYLRENGFSLSLDDYGSGYSTITYLIEVPFTIVKIDKGILWSAMKDEKFGTLLTSTVNMIRAFGKQCVVEGVENESMACALRELGVDFFQGYHYSKPLPPHEIIEFLKKTQGET